MSGRSPRTQDVVRDIAHRLPTLPIAMFEDLESAVGWLQRTGRAPAGAQAGAARSPTTEAKLRLAVHHLLRLVISQQHLQQHLQAA